jgi:peptide/nickel transport system substrate-binding protein
MINNWYTAVENASSQSARNAIAHQIDVQVMKDAVMLPAVYAKSVLYRPPLLTNVYVQEYYGMYDYGTLGLK